MGDMLHGLNQHACLLLLKLVLFHFTITSLIITYENILFTSWTFEKFKTLSLRVDNSLVEFSELADSVCCFFSEDGVVMLSICVNKHSVAWPAGGLRCLHLISVGVLFSFAVKNYCFYCVCLVCGNIVCVFCLKVIKRNAIHSY